MNCGPSSQGFKENEFHPYVSKFKELCDKFNDYTCKVTLPLITIQFGETAPFNMAECYPGFAKIIIDKKQYDPLPVENKEELIFHELGHCALLLEHTQTGIMKESGLHDPFFYRVNYSILINELFGCKTGDCEVVSYTETKGKKMSKKQEILENEHAVVRFTADWCGPCRNMKPVFEEVALANPTVKVYVIDIDKDEETAKEFGIKAIPTLLKIVDKQEAERTVGGQTKDKIEELFKK